MFVDLQIYSSIEGNCVGRLFNDTFMKIYEKPLKRFLHSAISIHFILVGRNAIIGLQNQHHEILLNWNVLNNFGTNHKVKDESNEECFSKYLKETLCRPANIWSVAIFRVHTFLFMAPQTQLPSFISYWSLHKNIISSLHMIEASVQAARSKRNNFFQIILERGIFWISDRSFNHTWCRQLCAAAHLCTLIKLKYFPTFFVS